MVSALCSEPSPMLVPGLCDIGTDCFLNFLIPVIQNLRGPIRPSGPIPEGYA